MPILKTVRLSVGEFALPAPLRGSIESHSGFHSTELGRQIHAMVQQKRKKAFPDYEAEVSVSHAFTGAEYEFAVGGRMDGFFSGAPRIEEIKTSFHTGELVRRLRAAPLEHPYCLQLATYGYFHWKATGQIPVLTFHLVSTRNFESEELELPFDPLAYEEWLARRMEVLVEEARAAEARARRRKSVKLVFPFDRPRRGQAELIETIEAGMGEGRPMLIQAPTGLGKTVGALYPSLKNALARAQRVVYVTPKNSQHALAEEAVAKLQEKGARLRSLTITAKSKICFKNEPICNPDSCEYARDHYTKLAAHDVLGKLAKKKRLDAKAFRKVAADHEVCPFEIQLDAALDADVVICDYNYVFAPRSAFGRMPMTGLDQEGRPNLVIDEAHNLPARAMDYYSPALSTVRLEKMRADLRQIPARFMPEALELLGRSIEIVAECGEGRARPARIDTPKGDFLGHEAELKSFLSRYLESETEILAGDPVLKFCFYWSAFTEALDFVEGDEFFTTFHPHPTGGTVKITCCDASRWLKGAYEGYEQVVAFSATLKPFAYYAQLSGLEDPKTAEFLSPFPVANRKLLVIPQISSKFSERERNYPRIAETITRIIAERPGNYFAFFPSFDFLERTLQKFREPEGFVVLRQERYMKAGEVEDILAHLRGGSHPTIIFAVQGGVFAEGVDYPGKMVIGAFVVGPPLPSFDLEREGMREYYEKNFSAGFDYAYTYPAMAKAVQSAGRVIRSETDQGLIVLLDNRFLQPSYVKSMPAGWFRRDPRELVSKSILAEVGEFWRGLEAVSRDGVE